MLKKALTPISILVLLVGVGLIVFSTVGGGDSDGETTATEVSAVSDSAVDASTTSGPADTAAPAGTTVAPPSPSSVASPSTTAAPSGSPSSLIIPTFPSFVLPPSSFVTISPGLIDAFSCNSFKDCAQRLYDAWKSNSKATASFYATPAAVNALFAYSYAAAPGTWSVTVSDGFSLNTFVALSNRAATPKSIQFKYDFAVSGFKVNTVQVF